MSVPISKFKAQCLAMLEEVSKTGRPLRVTRFGKPLVDIVPAALSATPAWLGLLEDQGEIVGDIVAPVADQGSWEVLAESASKARDKTR